MRRKTSRSPSKSQVAWQKRPVAFVEYSQTATNYVASDKLLPIGAILLAGSLGTLGASNASAQTAAAATTTPAAAPAASAAQLEPARTLKQVEVREKAEAAQGKDAIRATTTTIGKGKQELRDIPQSITVVTEKLIDDRNLDTVKDVLKNTAGATFQAAEGGEEDVRLRGFSLATTGDIYIDGMRDPAFYDRDTFNNDRVEVIRGSASMLFGRGSTGGAVNQSSKQPRLIDENEVGVTLGNHNYRRVTGDFNLKTGESSALRLNAMTTQADNNGAGASINKSGIAAAYRWGIGEQDEFQASLYSLQNRNGINYGLPYVLPAAGLTTASNTLLSGLDPSAYYGAASDRNNGSAEWLAFKHIHRFDTDIELQTQVRRGVFTRDQRASTVRFSGTAATAANPLTNPATVNLSNLSAASVIQRGTNNKVQDMDTLHAQSDLTAKFNALGFRHEVQAGVEFAQEDKVVYAARTAAQGGVDIVKLQTFYGVPNNGSGWVNEDARVFRKGNEYQAISAGVYAQDLVHITSTWKLLGGLRFDMLRGDYTTYAIPAAGPVTTSYRQDVANWSPRVGALYQPDALTTWHMSYGTSFNTSGDAYSYNAQSANTPPEKSSNFEIGGRFDSADKLATTRVALFHTVKENERNTDPDTAATRLLLSGKRHASGIEVDWTGRITPKWEIYTSYMWMPDAAVDVAASTAATVGNRPGDRPGLSPVHSGTVWSTYQLDPKWRVGGGLNFRSSQAPADTTPPAWEVPGFVILDLMTEYRIDDRWTLKGNISNVGNVLYADSLYRAHYVPGAGRLIQINLTAKF